ncbi:2-amino-4-hydroxy-6-hydroxymethyldihydropteridine diphosphokinase [Xanthomonas maliensis]|uniref:2-amino-4-hydroxy-6- hydroxymethyldihydropteridine diphosphokinase n=1 Tax=Xanthomonas maliensis TaxID=1321368 RepID=UPI0003A72F78|nr:2-amino-4-hydroxy-6-hydroxymethyldihydropteridine diphosphokinase [Xanthomonas maliensis]KAB7766473.1 2-amino-4-hydroxy-6-hydroxymethyldihydropteridine diphosphokinase [Xanthomonas maliensis]
MHAAFVGLGANLGPAEDSVRQAIAALGGLPQTRLIGASRLYRTPAWGRQDQPDFINAVVHLQTSLAPLALLDALLGIEQTFGRQRRDDDRWGPRTLDLDLLLYADQIIDQPRLQVPHPHLHARAFALLPLAELAPELRIPGHGTVRHALQGVDACGLEPIG